MGREALDAMQKQVLGMKRMGLNGFADASSAANYFAEKEKALELISGAMGESAEEIDGIKSTIKSIKDALKGEESRIVPLSKQEIEYGVGKTIAALWNGDIQTLGAMKAVPNLKSDNWNNPNDFEWTREKGFQLRKKDALGEPMGNLATNEQFLISKAFEMFIMDECEKKSVMMPLVRNVPMNSLVLNISEYVSGGVKLNWNGAYGGKIQATKPKTPNRIELKAMTLSGYIPWYDEFEEDSYAEFGKIFIKEFTDAYAEEFDRQCLVASSDPFTGALNASNAVTYLVDADVKKLTYVDLRNAELKVKAEERKNCCWFFNETVLNQLLNIVDANGNPIWRKPDDNKPGLIDGYKYYESSILPQLADIGKNTPFAVFMNPERIWHGNRKGVEIKRFDSTTESLEYGEIFLRFRKRSAFALSKAENCIVVLKTKE